MPKDRIGYSTFTACRKLAKPVWLNPAFSSTVKFASQVIICFLLLGLPSCSVQHGKDRSTDRVGPRASRTKLNVSTSSTTATQVVFLYAIEKGIFDKYGLEVTITPIDGGSRSLAALISRGVQLCETSGPAVVQAAVAGADVALIGGLVNTSVYSLLVADSIRSASDLKGKAIAISSPGSASEMAVHQALKILGLQPDRDVTVLAIGGQGERVAALQAGYVAGTVLDPPETFLVLKQGYHLLLDMSEMNLPDLHTGIATSRAFIEKNRSTVVNFMKAISEATYLIKRDKETTLALLGKLLSLDLHNYSAPLAETYEVLLKGKLVDIPYPSVDVIKATHAEITETNPNAVRFNPERVVDLSIVQELEDGGFYRDLWSKGP